MLVEERPGSPPIENNLTASSFEASHGLQLHAWLVIPHMCCAHGAISESADSDISASCSICTRPCVVCAVDFDDFGDLARSRFESVFWGGMYWHLVTVRPYLCLELDLPVLLRHEAIARWHSFHDFTTGLDKAGCQPFLEWCDDFFFWGERSEGQIQVPIGIRCVLG